MSFSIQTWSLVVKRAESIALLIVKHPRRVLKCKNICFCRTTDAYVVLLQYKTCSFERRAKKESISSVLAMFLRCIPRK